MAENGSPFIIYDGLITGTMQKYHIPGASISVIEDDHTWAKAYGISRYPKEYVNFDTLFNAASMSKAFVSAGLSLLVDDEALPDVQWSTPVSRLIRDDFVLSDSRYTDEVTLEDILSHRSGLPDQDDACFGVNAKSPDTIKSVVRKLRYLPLSAPIRAKFQYCNIMYVVAVHIIEKITGDTMTKFLRERIWNPLQMNNTFFGMEDIIKHQATDRVAKGYNWDRHESSRFEVPWIVQPEAAGAGEVHSTANDYAKFLRCMIDKAEPFSEAAHEELTKPRIIENYGSRPYLSPTLYALGWNVESYHGETVISHGGSTDGFGCNMFFLPQLKWGVVIFANTSSAATAIEKICWTMIDDVLKVPEEKRYDYDAEVQRELEEPDLTISDLYPNISSPPIPLSLPIASYVGSYHDDGYGTFNVECRNEKLEIDATDRTWRFKILFEHISGGHFVAHREDIDTRYRTLIKARFCINAAGQADQLGISLVDEVDGMDGMIWFRRRIDLEKLASP